jgi:NAD(P)-dependent dehydrogenase (short-subunit alcohol dehydrogenase family)
LVFLTVRGSAVRKGFKTAMALVDDSTLAHDLDFTGRRVLITGAAGGLGQSLASAFAQSGADLVLADIDEPGLAQVATSLGGGATTHRYDQSDLASIAALAAAVGRVDVLVNNAAVLLVEPLLETDPAAIRRVIDVNLVGPMVLARQIVPAMIAGGGGVIVNISSQLGFCGAAGRGVYATAKAGLAQFTKTAAVEWAPQGVRVLAIAPGRLLTTMSTFLGRDEAAYEAGIARVAANRYGTPEEIAKLVLVLASPLASYVVGDTLIADGGYVLG